MLDSSVYLASFGWKGKGNGLRHGSTSRPLAIPQKRTLTGLGKDRDEAFPFWDHLFAAAAKSIQIKVSGDQADIENDPPPQPTFIRTTTGILSNRRPVSGTPATSGAATPSDSGSQCPTPRLTLMASAKRESARKRLYAAFFRGPVLGPDADHDLLALAAQTVEEAQNVVIRSEQKQDEQETRRKSKEKKKRKRDDIEPATDEVIRGKQKEHAHSDHGAIVDEEAKTATMRDEGRQKSKAKRKGKQQDMKSKHVETAEERRKRKTLKAERKKLKEERRKRKEERRKTRARREASAERCSNGNPGSH